MINEPSFLILGTLVLTIFLINYFTHTSWMFWKYWWPGYSSGDVAIEYGPCHDLEIIPVWQKKFPKFSSESNIRLVNITNDDVLDIVLGFGTGKCTKVADNNGAIIFTKK